jgi:hypothetical protein
MNQPIAKKTSSFLRKLPDSPIQASTSSASVRRLGTAWISFCFALALHVIDEAVTGFLAIYNPTVIALRQEFRFWPMPKFEFREWLTGLIVLVILLFVLSPFMFRNARWVRPIAFFFVIVAGILNASGHTLATILGHTVSSVTFHRPAPGFYSSPLLFATACFVLLQLRATTPSRAYRRER